MKLFKAQAAMGSTFTVSSSRDSSAGVEIVLVPGSTPNQHNGAQILIGNLMSDSAIDQAVSRLKDDLDDAGAAAKAILK